MNLLSYFHEIINDVKELRKGNARIADYSSRGRQYLAISDLEKAGAKSKAKFKMSKSKFDELVAAKRAGDTHLNTSLELKPTMTMKIIRKGGSVEIVKAEVEVV